MQVLIVEDEPLMAEAIRDGLRLEATAAIAADIAGEGDTAVNLPRSPGLGRPASSDKSLGELEG